MAKYMDVALLLGISEVLGLVVTVFGSSDGSFIPAKPSKSQAQWLDYEVGASIHFNMQTFNRQMKRDHVAPPDTFNPYNLSTDQWIDAAASFGAKYVVLTLDHFSGFLLWPSGTYSYSVKNTRWRDGKGNIALDFINSCKKKNIQHGYFYSVYKNWFMNVENYSTKYEKDQKLYNEIVLAQLKELLGHDSEYSKPFYFWFDSGTDPKTNPDIGPLVRTLANETICDECKTISGNQGVRWVGNEQAVAPLPNWYSVLEGRCDTSQGNSRGKQFCPASCDTVVREHYWFWIPGTEHTVKTPQRLIHEYLTSVGRGCNLILNLSPDNRGLVEDEDLKAYRELGKGIELLYKYPVSTLTSPVLRLNQSFAIKLTYFSPLNGSIVLMEDIEFYGQLVEKYELRYISDNGVVSETGSSIGHKRIHPFPSSLSSAIINSIEVTIISLLTKDTTIRLREMAVYDWTEAENAGYLDQDRIFNRNDTTTAQRNQA